ncbi:MAG TPA: hypothetical protein VGM91_16715 [Conexibacter sp.]|jgi:hypothetical protein
MRLISSAERDHGRVASAVERGLFKSALDFYGAAGAVIGFDGSDRASLHWDLDRLQDVRAAMGALERRIVVALRAGLSAEQIATITRLEPDVIALIDERERAESDS